jgi:hypothetical protein
MRQLIACNIISLDGYLHLMIGPAFLGGGTPVFEGRSPVALRLLESRTLENSELVNESKQPV